jgi:hypothetical protein
LYSPILVFFLRQTGGFPHLTFSLLFIDERGGMIDGFLRLRLLLREDYAAMRGRGGEQKFSGDGRQLFVIGDRLIDH